MPLPDTMPLHADSGPLLKKTKLEWRVSNDPLKNRSKTLKLCEEPTCKYCEKRIAALKNFIPCQVCKGALHIHCVARWREHDAAVCLECTDPCFAYEHEPDADEPIGVRWLILEGFRGDSNDTLRFLSRLGLLDLMSNSKEYKITVDEDKDGNCWVKVPMKSAAAVTRCCEVIDSPKSILVHSHCMLTV